MVHGGVSHGPWWCVTWSMVCHMVHRGVIQDCSNYDTLPTLDITISNSVFSIPKEVYGSVNVVDGVWWCECGGWCICDV